MNGSRLKEHRKRRVVAVHWMVLIAIIAAIFALSPWLSAEAQEYKNVPMYKPFSMSTGVIVEGAELCFSPDLSQPTVELLNTWQRLVNELEAYERGGSVMNEEDANYAQTLSDVGLCATVAEYYNIVITQATEGYVLVNFDEQYGFDTGTFIVARKDIMPDRGL